MDIKDIIKKYGGSEETMDIVSDVMSEYVPEDVITNLSKMVYENVQGKHFNEEFAKEQISKMYFEEDGYKHFGPYYDNVAQLYLKNKRRLVNPYNRWDFEVALNMIKSDNILLLKQWFPEDSKEQLDSKIVEMTINWLNDEDNPYGDSKIWCYFR